MGSAFVIVSWPHTVDLKRMEELDALQQQNNLIADQLNVIIEQIHGSPMPFILIMPPLEDETEAQMVTNVDSIKYIQRTIRKLDVSLSKVSKLKTVKNPIQ